MRLPVVTCARHQGAQQFTLVGVNPALDAFTEQARELHTVALGAAREAGQALAA